MRRGWTPADPPGNGPRLRTGGPVCRPYRKGAAYGGRVRTPAPTRIQGRPHSPRRGRSQTGPVCRPYIIPELSRGAPWGSRQKLPQPRVHPHPAGRRPATFPLVGGRLAGGHMGPPLRRERPRDVGSEAAGAGIKSHQFQFSSCSGPQWGRTECTQALLILRAGSSLPASRGNPRKQGPGERRLGAPERCSSGAVPGGVLVTLPPRAKSLATRRRRNPPASGGMIE